MRLEHDSITDFRGGVNAGAPLTEFPANQSPLIVNGDVGQDGRVRRRLGTTRTHSARLTGTGGIVALVAATQWWTPALAAQRVAIVWDSAYYSNDSGATWTLIADTIVIAPSPWSFAVVTVSGVPWLYAANGGTTYRWDGSSVWEPAPGVPTDVRFLAVFGDRLYVAGHAGTLVQGSAIGDPEDFTVPNGLAVPVNVGHGQEQIRGLFPVGPVLLVHHREATSYISGFGQSDLIVAAGATGASRSVGLLSHTTVQDIGAGTAIWLSARGFELYDGAMIHPISTPQLDRLVFSEEAIDLMDTLTGATLGSLFLPTEQQYWCALFPVTYEFPIVKFDLRTRAWSLHYYGFRAVADATTPADIFNAAQISAPGSLVAGHRGLTFSDSRFATPEALGADGWYRRLDLGDTDDADTDGSNGSPIEMQAESRPLTFGDVFRRKRARQIRASAVTAAPVASVDVAPIIDGKRPGGPNLAPNPGFETGSLAPWDVDAAGGTWSVVSTDPRTGGFCLQYNTAGQSGFASARTTAADAGVAIAADGGDVIEFGMWGQAGTADSTATAAGIIFRDAGNNILRRVHAPFTGARLVFLTDTYRLATLTATAPPGTAYVQGEILVPDHTQGQLLRFDDVSLRVLRRHRFAIPTGNGNMPRQRRPAPVNGRGRTLQVQVVTLDAVELVGVDMRAELLTEP